MKFLLSLLVILSFNCVAAEDAGKVVLSLKEYNKLIEESEKTSMHVIENLTLNGSYPNNVSIEIKGQYTNKPEPVSFIQHFEHAVKNCSGSGIISTQSNHLQVFPLKKKYSVTCDLIIKSKQSFDLKIKNVMNFDNKLSKAEAIIDGNPTSYLTVKILRKVKKVDSKKADIIRTGRYKLYIGPNSTTFEYSFVLNNPNRNKVTETINWVNSELIKQVHTDLDYNEKTNALTVELNPGDNNISVFGTINSTSFKPILHNANQFFMIENHAIIQVKTSSKWRRISNNESGLNATKPSAKSYLVSNSNQISWSVKKLKLFSSTGYSVKSQNIKYYVPKDGQPIVNMTYVINNQGTPEVPLKIDGQVTYLEVNKQAAPLYKDEQENLLVSIPQGKSVVLIQYRPKIKVGGISTIIESTFAKPNAVVSNSYLEVTTPQDWDLYFGKYNKDFSSIIKAENIPSMLFFMFIVFMGLSFLKLSKKTVIILVVSLGAIKLFRPGVDITIYALLVGLYIVHYFDRIRAFLGKSSLMKFAGYSMIMIVGVVIFMISIQNFKKYQAKSSRVMSDAIYESNQVPTNKRVSKGGGGSGSGFLLGLSSTEADEEFQGVPAKIDMPSGVKYHYFSKKLVNIDGTLKAKLYFVKGYFLDLYMFFFSIIIFITLYRKRAEFRALI